MITFAELQQTEEWQKYALPAKEHYAELPYHNWEGHVLPSVEYLLELSNRCEKRGIRLPVGRLAVAMTWHDARSFEDPKEHRYATEEDRSGALAQKFLLKQGASATYAQRVREDIIGTQANRVRRNITQMALHWADVGNIGKPYDVFAGASGNLLQERRLKMPDLSFAKHVEDSRMFIGMLILESHKELKMLGEPTQGEGAFPVVALDNSRRLGVETEESLLQYAT